LCRGGYSSFWSVRRGLRNSSTCSDLEMRSGRDTSSLGERERLREEGREGGGEREREGGREGGREEGREREREGGREKKRGAKGRRKGRPGEDLLLCRQRLVIEINW